jgi:hypothetical protein
MVVRYYKQERNGPGNLKNKVLSHKDIKKSFEKPQLESKSVGKSPVVSYKHLYRGCLNSPTSHLQYMAILLLLVFIL